MTQTISPSYAEHRPPVMEEFVVVQNKRQRQSIIESALVLTAMEIDNFVEHDDEGWHLYVQRQNETHAVTQLSLYHKENLPPKEQPVPFEIVDDGWYGVFGYLGVIWLIPGLQSYLRIDLLSLGRLQAGLVEQGEWWRAITALTLHSDIAHISSNSLFGLVFGLFVGRHLGSGLGWLLVLLCGFLANLLNAWVQPDQFSAIGASTATFACLGIVPAFGWRRGFFRGRGWARGFAPIFGAIALLAFTGFGSERVDVLGHLFGFGIGIGMGLLVAHIKLNQISLADQQRAGGFAVFAVLVAWLSSL